MRVIETRRATELPTSATNHARLFDLGQNASYMPRLRVSGPAGSTVRLTPSEIINEDGTLNRGTMGGTSRGGSWWAYTKRTGSVETWSPQFCYIGCRYLQADFTPARPGGQLPRIEALDGQIVHSIAMPVGDFECSNPLLNRIRDLVRWAQRANMVSVLTDCPHREKLGWLEQYHLNGPSIRYEFDVSRIFTKGMNDMANSQLENGLVPNIAPEYTQFPGTFRAAAEWGSAFIIVPWQQYLFDADLDLLRTHYDAMKRYFAYLESRATNDIVAEGLGDWYDLGPKKPGVAQLTPPPITASAFYFCDAGSCRKPPRCSARARTPNITRPGRSAFAPATTASSSMQTPAATPPDHNARMPCRWCWESSSPLIARRCWPRWCAMSNPAATRMTAGDVGFRFLLQALAQGDRNELIYRHDQPGRKARLRLSAEAGSNQPHGIVGRQPDFLAQSFHARPDHRVVLQGPGGHRLRPCRAGIQKNHD